jgi:hypothetical protein
VDGQQFSFGHTGATTSCQSTMKPFLYASALEEAGLSTVHNYVGFEPSGLSFNEISLNAQGRPHNALVNAGAIAVGSLIAPHLDSAGKFRHFFAQLKELAGREKIGFSHATYLTEHETAWRNRAIVAYMQDAGCFPPGAVPAEALDFYLQCCSVEVSTRQSATMAATLANGGVCPLTGARVFSPSVTRQVLNITLGAGMYDYRCVGCATDASAAVAYVGAGRDAGAVASTSPGGSAMPAARRVVHVAWRVLPYRELSLTGSGNGAAVVCRRRAFFRRAHSSVVCSSQRLLRQRPCPSHTLTPHDCSPLPSLQRHLDERGGPASQVRRIRPALGGRPSLHGHRDLLAAPRLARQLGARRRVLQAPATGVPVRPVRASHRGSRPAVSVSRPLAAGGGRGS